MKRCLFLYALAALMAVLVWMLLVVLRVKVADLALWQYIYWASVAVVFVIFPTISLLTFKGRPIIAVAAAAFSFLVIAPVFVYSGMLLAWQLKTALSPGP